MTHDTVKEKNSMKRSAEEAHNVGPERHMVANLGLVG